MVLYFSKKCEKLLINYSFSNCSVVSVTNDIYLLKLLDIVQVDLYTASIGIMLCIIDCTIDKKLK